MHRVDTEALPTLAGEAPYPDPSSFPHSEVDKLLEMPNGKRITLEWLREEIWGEAEEFEIPAEDVTQGKQAIIFPIVLRNSSGTTMRLIAKRVLPTELPPKGRPGMWLDFAASAAREIDFYSGLLKGQDGQEIRPLFPACYYSDYTEGLEKYYDPYEDVSAAAQGILSEGFFFLLMADVSGKFYQKASLSRTQAKALLAALARFHAHFWQEKEVQVKERERGGFWTLDRRKILREVEDANTTWAGLLERLPELKDLVPDCQNLAGKLAKRASELDLFVSRRSWLTTIHGDCKAWNIFLTKDGEVKSIEEDRENVLLIDMQWTGKGHPLQDVAYALTTSLECELLPEMDSSVDFYLEELQRQLESRGKLYHANVKDLRSHFDLVWLDYARVIVTGLWKRLSKEQMERYRDVVGPSMINKSLPHIQFIIERIHQKLVEEDVCSVLEEAK